MPLRNSRSDYFKGVSILGVVILHCDLPYADAFLFCVPVFVTIWGYHYEIGLSRLDSDQRMPYVTQRILKLIVPFLFWTALYIGFGHPWQEWKETPIRTIIGGWFGGYGWPGQYFFIILLQLTLLMPLFRHWLTQKTVWPILITAIAANTLTLFYFTQNEFVSSLGPRLFIYWLLYMYLGISFARGYIKPLPWLFPIACSLLLLSFGHLYKNMELREVTFKYLLPNVTLGSVFMLIAFGPRCNHPAAAKIKAERMVSKILRYIGKRSFAIYVAHILILKCVWNFSPLWNNSDSVLPVKIATVIVAVGMSLVIASLMKKAGMGILVGE